MARLTAVTIAFSLALLGRAAAASASPDSEDGEDATADSAVPVAKPGSDVTGRGLQRAAKPGANKSRKRSRVAGFAVPESKLRAEVPESPSGRLKVISLATHEEAEVQIFNEDGSYNLDALHAVDHILRGKRTDTEKPIEPRLYVILSHVYDHFGKPLEVVSGFRNQRRQTSFHFKGSASDIRIAGVPPKKLRDFADSLDAGGMGVGLYPRAQFVHIDVRPLPSYRWIDNARPTHNSPDKRPPRGFKRKKLQS
jgi:uncharacterized protein YcbK (DUF882 family)